MKFDILFIKLKPSVLYSVFIFIVILLPISLKLAGKDINIDIIKEKRVLASAPDFKQKNLQELTKRIDQYFNDRMPFRQIFVLGYIFTAEHLLENYVSLCVTGKGKELFMYHPVIDAALQITPYSLRSQELLRLSAAGKYAFFYSKNIPYYQFIAPDKSTLYPDLLPFYSKWIKHDGWYKYQIDALKNAKIPFYDYKEVFDKYKYKLRLYDEKYDHVHWNGNGLKIAYQYMADILSRDNPIFKAVKSPEYYSTYDADVNCVYGKERITMINLNNEGISCSLPPDELLLDVNKTPYQKLCINKNKSKGTLWFFSDSYFGDTHGSKAVTPFVHNVHTYYHSHYVLTKPYTVVANERFTKFKPDAVIEEFVERMGGTTHAENDPLLRILGDIYLKTGGFIFDKSIIQQFNSNNIAVNNAKIINMPINNEHHIDNINKDSHQKNNVFVFKSSSEDSSFNFKIPVKADYLGRVVIMARYKSPEKTSAKVYYHTDETSVENKIVQDISNGINTVHMTVHVKPYENVFLRFSPGSITNADYIFEDIEEVNDLRERMNKDGI